jgi:copper chaperone CopZ
VPELRKTAEIRFFQDAARQIALGNGRKKLRPNQPTASKMGCIPDINIYINFVIHYKFHNKMKKLFILLVATASMSIADIYAQTNDDRQDTTVVKTTRNEKKNVKTNLRVKGSCSMCKSRIEKVAKNISGVNNALWDLKSETLNLDYNTRKTSPDAVGKALAEAGHDNEKHKADDKVYDALPACCRYRE